MSAAPKSLTIKALSEALDAVEFEAREVVGEERALIRLRDAECESSKTGAAPRCGHCLHVQGEWEARLNAARVRLRDAKGRVFALVAKVTT